MKNVAKLAVYAGLGLYDRLREAVDDLVKRGELMQQEGEQLLAEARDQESARVLKFQDKVETAVRGALERVPLPASAKEVAALEERVAALEARLAEAKDPVTA